MVHWRFYSLFLEVRSFNVQAESEPSLANKSTLATFPGGPALSNASYHSIKVITNDGANPANSILIAIQFDGSIFGGKTTKYVQSDGTLGDTPAWNFGPGWGGAVGVTVVGLYPGTAYDVTLISANSDTVMAGSGAPANLGTLPAVDPEATPVLESFTTTTFPPPGWLRFDVDNDGTSGTYGMWHRSTTNLHTAPGAARYFCNDPVGQPNGAPVGLPGNDYLYTHVATLGGVRYNITFYYRTVPGLGHDIATVLSSSQNPAGTLAILLIRITNQVRTSRRV